MRCFLSCFPTSKRPNQCRSSPTTHVGEGAVEELIHCIAESKIKNEKGKESTEEEDINKRWHQDESSESLFSLSICSRKQVSDAEAEVNSHSPMQLVCTREVPQPQAFGSSEKDNPKHHQQKPSFLALATKNLDEKEGDKGKANHPSYRYRDCHDDDIYLDVSDLDGNDKREDPTITWVQVQEDSSESLFSLSMQRNEAENEVNSPRSVHTDLSSVLNPIENLSQGRVVVAKATVGQPLKNDKENINLDVDMPSSPYPKRQEIGVDTSLSSWLVEFVGELTPSSHEERPILGPLTVEEIRMYSLSASSRRSRSRSPDETPIIGTVGSYWTHTHQTMNLEFNTSAKDVKSKRTSTALQTTLEPASEASVSKV